MKTYKVNLKATITTDLSKKELNKKIILGLFDADVSIKEGKENNINISIKKEKKTMDKKTAIREILISKYKYEINKNRERAIQLINRLEMLGAKELSDIESYEVEDKLADIFDVINKIKI